MKPSNVSNRRLLVEGESDRQVVLRLLIGGDFTFCTDEILVEDANGIENVVDMIYPTLRAPPFDTTSSSSAVGVVVDADRDVNLVWQRIATELIRAGVDVPTSYDPNPDGSFFVRRKPYLNVGIWIMPDNVHPGELEDFLVSMVPCEDTDWRLAREYVRSTERKFGKKVTRAEVWAWIATRKEPSRFDEAIKNGDLCTDGDLCQTFIAWLSRLFAPDEEVANTA